jgi:8-oxo-dGTP diphosphatase
MRARTRRSYALIVRDGKALVVRNRAGRWTLPGGRAKRGETLRDTVVREVREETGLRIRVRGRISPKHVRRHDGPCASCVVYAAKVKSGDPRPRREIDKLRWVPIERVPSRLTRFRRSRMVATLAAHL